MDERACTKCHVVKPMEEFGWKYKSLGKRHAVCKECTSVRSSNWYYQNQDRQKENVRLNNLEYRKAARDFMFDYLSTHPCTKCGETDPVVLEFHHLGEKSSEVSRLLGRGVTREALKAEIDKCVVVCANCHRRITAEQRSWYKRR